jgi:hypothetical protein
VVSVEMHPCSQQVVWALGAILHVALGLTLPVQIPGEVGIIVFTLILATEMKL